MTFYLEKPSFLEPPNTGHTPTDHEMHKKSLQEKKKLPLEPGRMHVDAASTFGVVQGLLPSQIISYSSLIIFS